MAGFSFPLGRRLKRERAQKEKGKRIVIRKSVISLVHEAGQSLVEFALVTLFVILPVTFGIIDGSILFYKWVTLTNGAREGARAGAIYQDSRVSNGSEGMMLSIDAARANVITQTVEAMVRPLVSIQWNPPGEYWNISYPDGKPCVDKQCDVVDVYRGGDRVTVAITHTHTSIVGLVIGLGKINLTASATMRIEPGGPAPTPTS
jgi:hypothetical protein